MSNDPHVAGGARGPHRDWPPEPGQTAAALRASSDPEHAPSADVPAGPPRPVMGEHGPFAGAAGGIVAGQVGSGLLAGPPGAVIGGVVAGVAGAIVSCAADDVAPGETETVDEPGLRGIARPEDAACEVRPDGRAPRVRCRRRGRPATRPRPPGPRRV